MKIKNLSTVLALSFILFCIGLVLAIKSPGQVLSATTHVVISEIQIGGTIDNDEFVELYNPTGSPVNLSGWRLTKKTATGTESDLVASMSGTIPANGYFLVTSNEASASGSADLLYSNLSNHLDASNSATLYSDAGTTTVDLVGMGSAISNETVATVIPPAGSSIERKANSSSNNVTMGVGGADEFAGNGQDTDNNLNDFVLRNTSQPQNSSITETPLVSSPSPSGSVSPTPTQSPSESPSATPSASPVPTVTPDVSPSPVESPVPSATPDISPSVSPTPLVSPSATPNVSPSATPVPTVSPSELPSVSPSATPTVLPSVSASPVPSIVPSASPSTNPSSSPSASASPEASATPEVSASPAVSPSASPTPEPTPHAHIIFRGFLFTCFETRVHFGFFSFPHITCTLNSRHK